MCIYVYVFVFILFIFQSSKKLKNCTHHRSRLRLQTLTAWVPTAILLKRPMVSSSLKDHHDLGLRRPATACAVMWSITCAFCRSLYLGRQSTELACAKCLWPKNMSMPHSPNRLSSAASRKSGSPVKQMLNHSVQAQRTCQRSLEYGPEIAFLVLLSSHLHSTKVLCALPL